MILKLHPDHGYNELGISRFGDALGRDITIEELAEIHQRVHDIELVHYDGAPNTLYVGYPGGRFRCVPQVRSDD